jgi:general secretion pathway protein M
MITSITGKKPRGALFLAFNISFLFLVVTFLLAPVLAHFSGRSEDIAENAAQLAHFRKIARSANTPTNEPPQSGDPFLPGGEERIVSADLQANLKAISASAGVSLLGVRGLPGSRSQQLHVVAVSVELEGSLPAVRDMIVAIENQTPVLFVTAASFRSMTEGDDGPIRAELKVQGAMRDAALPGSVEAVSR